MGARVHKLKKQRVSKTSEEEEEKTKGARDAWHPKSDATPAPLQSDGRHTPPRRTG
jgi:hypothetical protein